MKTNLFLLVTLFIFTACAQEKPESKTLFNGTDLSGWHVDVPAMDNDPEVINPFIVRDNMLATTDEPQGHIITNAEYENYRLDVQYRFVAEEGNCGVMIHVSTLRAMYDMFPKSIEVQMKYNNAGDFICFGEDITVPSMEERRGPKESWGVTEGKARRIKHLTDGAEMPVGEWNNMVIECVGDQVKVWVNNILMNHGYDCTAQKGKIALQAEGSEVEFRKIEITQITEITE